jgi:hypothetical protein
MVVLGTCHEIQGFDKSPGLKFEDPDFPKVLDQIIQSKHPRLIFEEAGSVGPSTAERIATAQQMEYIDVDPGPEERKKLGILDTHDCLPVDLLGGSQESLCWHELKAHEVREQVWLRKVREQAFESALLICGLNHMLSMSFRLRNEGIEVEAAAYEPRRLICEGLRKRLRKER